MTWFDQLLGFDEQTPDQVRASIDVNGNRMRSHVNGRELSCGSLEILSLADLRSRIAEFPLAEGRLQITEVIADVQSLHKDAQNAGALFQVASQFNLLEMVSPSRTPEHGIGIYENDHTQGPACAIAAGAGTIFRNYFVPVNGQIGQSADNQVDCLSEMGAALGNDNGRLWAMRNGYALPSAAGLQEIYERLMSMSDSDRDELGQKLRIGIHHDTQVTLGQCQHTVSQAYCSALPVAYCSHRTQLWEPFARLILDAAYEATFCAATLNSLRTGNRRVFLTLLGGGAFGNESDWIFAALEKSLTRFAGVNLDIAIVSHGASNSRIRQLTEGRR